MESLVLEKGTIRIQSVISLTCLPAYSTSSGLSLLRLNHLLGSTIRSVFQRLEQQSSRIDQGTIQLYAILSHRKLTFLLIHYPTRFIKDGQGCFLGFW